MPSESTFKSPLSEQPVPTDQPPSTLGLMGQLFAEATKLRSPKVSQRRIKWLLTKTHTVGAITLNLPTLVGFQELQKIQHLRDTHPAQWVCESLFILAHQRTDAIFLTGEERQIAIQQHLDRTGLMATDLPKCMVALLEMLTALEKKSAAYSLAMTNLAKTAETEISRLASSASSNPPAFPSTTSQPN